MLDEEGTPAREGLPGGANPRSAPDRQSPSRAGDGGGLVLCRWCGSPFRLVEGQLYVTPTHPALAKPGEFIWRMCKGSNKGGTPIQHGRAS